MGGGRRNSYWMTTENSNFSRVEYRRHIIIGRAGPARRDEEKRLGFNASRERHDELFVANRVFELILNGLFLFGERKVKISRHWYGNLGLRKTLFGQFALDCFASTLGGGRGYGTADANSYAGGSGHGARVHRLTGDGINVGSEFNSDADAGGRRNSAVDVF